MNADVRELLPLYVLGVLEAEEAQQVERAVASDAALAAELASYQDAAGALGAAIAPADPPPHVLQRLLGSSGGGRFEHFAARMAQLFDVTLDRARELLGLIERPASWVPQIPGISLIHFEGGPAAAGADCGFVRLAPGTIFPPHTHLGDEVITMLSGRARDLANQHEVGLGEDYIQVEGTTHYLVCVGDGDCIYASRAMNGIAIGGTRVHPMKN